jgi:hypothetical protein
MTFSLTTLSIMGHVKTPSINDAQHNSIEYHYDECRYAECRDYLNVILSVVMLNVVMLSVVRLNGVMLSVVMLSVIVHLRNHACFVPCLCQLVPAPIACVFANEKSLVLMGLNVDAQV